MQFDYDQYGSAFIDMRLHRLRVLITAQLDEFFAEAGVAIPSPCVSVVLFLAQRRKASISSIAETLGYSHQLITQRLLQLEELKCIHRLEDPRDRRKRLIALTAKGRRQATLLQETLPRAAEAFDALFDDLKINLPAAVKDIEKALKNDPLTDRLARLETSQLSARKRA